MISFQKHYFVCLMKCNPKATFASKYNDPCRKYQAFIYNLQRAFLFLNRMFSLKERNLDLPSNGEQLISYCLDKVMTLFSVDP